MFRAIILIDYIVDFLRESLSSDISRIEQICRFKGGFLGSNLGGCKGINKRIVLGT
jgi:hypothetical protein